MLKQSQFAQLPVCRDPSVNAKCDKNLPSAIPVLGARASLETQISERAELYIDGILEENSLRFSLLCLGSCSKSEHK